MRRLLYFSVFSFIIFFSCKFDQSKSSTKEFEFSADICRDVQQAVDKRWTSGMGVSKAAYHSKLVNQETSIIVYELPRYRRRMEEVKSNTGPANGPNTNEKLQQSGSAISPSSQSGSPSSKPSASNSTPSKPSSLSLAGGSGQGNVSVASEVCPGCDKTTIARKLAILEKNQSEIHKCAYRDASDSANSTSAIDPDQGLSVQEKAERAAAVKDTKNLIFAATQPKELCEWFGRWSTGSGASRNRCNREGVEVFCKSFVDMSGNIAVDAINGKISGDRITSQAVKPIPGYIKDLMIACSQQWAYEKLKEAYRDGTYRDLTKALKDQAKDAIVSDQLGSVSQKKKMEDLKKNIALAVCKAGAGLVASQIDATPQINFDQPCAAIFSGSKSRAKACLNTTASGCRIAAGDIDVRNFLPAGITDDRPLATLSAEAVNTIAGMGCKSLQANVACGAISEAASQIRSAITTGNNDWASCVGTDQVGACSGTVMAELWLGVKISDSEKPVRQPYEVDVVGAGRKEMITDACVCEQSCFEDEWGSDAPISSGSYADRLIRGGDAGIRDCERQNGRWNWLDPNTGYQKSKNDKHLYWRTSNCRIRQLRNIVTSGGFQIKAEILEGPKWADARTFNVTVDGICQNR